MVSGATGTRVFTCLFHKPLNIDSAIDGLPRKGSFSLRLRPIDAYLAKFLRSFGELMPAVGALIWVRGRIAQLVDRCAASSFARCAPARDGRLAAVFTVSPTSTSWRMASERVVS